MRPDFPKIDVHKTGQNIRRIMVGRGMKVRDIQEYLGFSAPQSIYHWFAGKSLLCACRYADMRNQKKKFCARRAF